MKTPQNQQVKQGSTVSVHYTGTLSDGTQFDSSIGSDPLEFVVGGGMLIPGFEQAIMGLGAGDKTKTTITPEEAYGQYSEDLVISIPRDQVPEHISPTVGLDLQLATEEGDIDVTITEVHAQYVTLDSNHPLAGKELIFEIEIISVKN